jgi:acetyl/propionyl-CoA carboxylase alpha subunit/acetyl-CoA carboxylase carboxyltransferase component
MTGTVTARAGPLRRVLIANRGEIAIRIARAADALGIESVAVYPPADERSLHTRVATERHAIGGDGDPVAAYLDAEALVAVAVESGCDCVHPGYGFLAENTAFAERCAAAGITFIGPPPDALALFGDKVAARALARKLGVAVVEGSDDAVASAAEAADAAAAVGYPVMLKAAAGGGGRGMRVVERAGEMAEAFERCRGEAAAAFGDGTLFVERLLPRPRHIEVQVLADTHGGVVHLFDRDCSVQLRNQKVIEVAPAPGLDPELREQILDSAITLAKAAGYANAGTVEFLVSPERGEHAFIECNPRIQVEHTVTEQVTGIDLVEAQLLIAGGATLAELGIAGQGDVTTRGFAVQARVVAAGAGTLTAYQEPSGAGVRVDAAGYVGYSPPPQFDPLLAKVIGSSPTADVAAAVDRTRRAVEAFHIDGLPTNRAQLLAILASPEVRAGDARTTLLAEAPELATVATATADSPLAELGASAAPAPALDRPGLAVGPDQQPVRSPMGGTVIEVRARRGDAVRAGDGLLVISAMKMEAVVTAPCAGTITGLLDLAPGDAVIQDMVVAVVTPSDEATSDGGGLAWKPDETWQPVLDDVAQLQGLAAARLAPGSEDPGVVRQRSRRKLTCRERIALLLDDGSFREVGSLAGFASYDDEGRIVAFTPANHVGGWGTIDGRTAVVCADDFTSRGGHADGAIGAKSFYLDQLSLRLQVPSVRLLDGSSGGGSVTAMVPQQKAEGESAAQESTGAIEHGKPRVSGGGGSFLPGHLGSTEYAEQLATVPVVNVLLGSVVGIGAAKAVLGHFSVMVRDISQLFVAGPPVVSHAMGYDISKEELGGWQVHCRNGSVDNLAETEEEAAAMTKRFLSYLPTSVHEAPPVVARTDSPDRREDELLTIIPRKRTTTFDVRRVIELLVDRDSWFEIGALWGTDQVVGLARVDGHPVGVLASDSRHVNGGALTADGCSKLIRHLDLCDLFHVPIVNLIDNPGFAVGLEHEITGTIRRGGEWMVAFAQVQVPIFSVLMRRSFGVAGNNQATPTREPNVRVTWPAADVGGIPPEGGIEAAYKRQLAEAADPVALRAELEARIESVRGPIGPLNRFQIEELIDPRDTRRYLCEWIGPASRVATAPAKLAPRALQFRP